MYTVSDVVEIGKAQDLILTEVKEISQEDDFAPQTLRAQEYFDE